MKLTVDQVVRRTLCGCVGTVVTVFGASVRVAWQKDKYPEQVHDGITLLATSSLTTELKRDDGSKNQRYSEQGPALGPAKDPKSGLVREGASAVGASRAVGAEAAPASTCDSRGPGVRRERSRRSVKSVRKSAKNKKGKARKKGK